MKKLWKYQTILNRFLSSSLTNTNLHDFQKATADPGLKSNENINTAEIVEEIKNFKQVTFFDFTNY